MLFSGALPPEVISNAARVVLTGRESVLVEQHDGILAYDAACVTLRTARGLLRIAGDGLGIREYSPADIIVTGRIDSLGFLP